MRRDVVNNNLFHKSAHHLPLHIDFLLLKFSWHMSKDKVKVCDGLTWVYFGIGLLFLDEASEFRP